MGKTHMAFGALFWVAGAGAVAEVAHVDLGPTELVGGLAIATVAGLLPDIDHPDALLTRGWVPGRKLLGPLGKPVGWLFALPPRIVGKLARTTMGHRGGTHSFAFAALWTFGALPLYGLMAGLIAWVLSAILTMVGAGFDPAVVWSWEREHLPAALPCVMIAVGLGYLSHLFADSLNTVPAGPLFWPFSKRRPMWMPKGLRIRVDSPAEALVRSLVILAVIAIGLVTIALPVYNATRDAAQKASTEIQQQVKERKDGSPAPARRTRATQPAR